MLYPRNIMYVSKTRLQNHENIAQEIKNKANTVALISNLKTELTAPQPLRKSLFAK